MLNWISNSYADARFDKFARAIQNHHISELHYNPSKTRAIGSLKGDTAVYIHFKEQKTYTIISHQPGLIGVQWLNNTVAAVETSCGTGCAKSLIFIAPNITIACATHQYRIHNLDPHTPPDYYHNRPLLIDSKRRIYVCYDENDAIQVYPFPRHASIHPPKGHFTNKASFVNGKLVVDYEDRQGHTQQITY